MCRLPIVSGHLLLLVFLALLETTCGRPGGRRADDPLLTIPTSDLKKFTAPNPAMVLKEWNGMGDSFTAGVGSGVRDDFAQECERWSNAYVKQMNENEDLGIPGTLVNRYPTHSACTGAKTSDVSLF